MFLLFTSIWAFGAFVGLYIIKNRDKMESPELEMAMGQMPGIVYWMALLWPLTFIISVSLGNKDE